ncbi:sodium:neurotransmitter symporter family protein [bacterium BMS3Bbin09]|nr:sodium:neurotransmitter symporter family protein [bacterium BMS3Bbin09]HDH34116.1 sodium-dependent transporter [Nitrospirota bacterium]HDN95288.1 sodium-dependent transporter [Nitrospirota bacterium]
MKREQWNSQFGFLLAAVGSAIGLGNIWRFSYMAYSNGGGAFLIPYIIALLTAGVSLLLLEFAIGHERIGSAPLAFARINKKWEWLGWWSVIFVMFGIELYYNVIIAWCINFFFYSFDLSWGSDPNTFFFKEFLQLNTDPANIGNIRTPILGSLIIVWFLNWIIVFRGIRKGIELANKIFMPMLFLLTAVLVLWAVNLEGASDGIRAYLTPDFSKLSEPKVWIDAFSQIFFTLSLGFGIMIAYASYLPSKANITKYAVLTAFINSGYSIFAGFAVFSVLGFMAASQGKPMADVVTKSIGLAFVAYPQAVSLMPGGNIFGAIFFLSLVIAGLSSSISIIEAFTSAVVDKFNVNRKHLVTLICVTGFLGSIIFITQAGLIWLDIVDHFLTHYALVIVGIGECLIVGWFFRTETLRKHINKISSIKIGVWWDYLIKVFVPLVLGVILIGDLYIELKNPYEGYSWTALILIGWNWLLLTLVAAFFMAMQPWKDDSHKASGRTEH